MLKLREIIRKVIKEETDSVGDLKVGDSCEVVSKSPPHKKLFTGKVIRFQKRGSEVVVGSIRPPHPSQDEIVVDGSLVNKIYSK